MKKKLIVIAGPTASGKTALAKKLIKKFNGEVISADSRQVYIGLDIGTGKDKTFFQYLIDIARPETQFTVADFQKKAQKAIKEIYKKGKNPFIVGGTGFYIDSFLKRKKLAPQIKNEKIRQNLQKLSSQELFEKLKKIDPKIAEKIDKNNKRRITRALEVCLSSKKPFSSFGKEIPPLYDVLYLCLTPPRKKLYKLIDERVEKRIKEGVIKEVKNLIKKGVSSSWLKSLGLDYRYITEYLEGKYKKEEMIQKLKYAIHSFARRQITWFSKNEKAICIKNEKEAEKKIKNFLKNEND